MCIKVKVFLRLPSASQEHGSFGGQVACRLKVLELLRKVVSRWAPGSPVELVPLDCLLRVAKYCAERKENEDTSLE